MNTTHTRLNLSNSSLLRTDDYHIVETVSFIDFRMILLVSPLWAFTLTRPILDPMYSINCNFILNYSYWSFFKLYVRLSCQWLTKPNGLRIIQSDRNTIDYHFTKAVLWSGLRVFVHWLRIMIYNMIYAFILTL